MKWFTSRFSDLHPFQDDNWGSGNPFDVGGDWDTDENSALQRGFAADDNGSDSDKDRDGDKDGRDSEDDYEDGYEDSGDRSEGETDDDEVEYEDSGDRGEGEDDDEDNAPRYHREYHPHLTGMHYIRSITITCSI